MNHLSAGRASAWCAGPGWTVDLLWQLRDGEAVRSEGWADGGQDAGQIGKSCRGSCCRCRGSSGLPAETGSEQRRDHSELWAVMIAGSFIGVGVTAVGDEADDLRVVVIGDSSQRVADRPAEFVEVSDALDRIFGAFAFSSRAGSPARDGCSGA